MPDSNPAASVPFPGASGNLVALASGPLYYMGFTARETAGAAASFRIRDGGVAGAILESVALALNSSAPPSYYENGILCVTGILYYEKIVGTIEGAARYG